ncbi:hypothetical protein PG997_001917 [Apiospora hydei]|uniref:Uncharacterized protein n=1 Tax=Apiospora hydei TaxID=1337664 RepID=A0ABR1X7W8_9PEZI
MAGFRSAAAARDFFKTLGEEKPGQPYTVTPLDIETIEKMFDIFTDITVDWERLADRSLVGDSEAAKIIFGGLAAFEEEMKYMGIVDVPLEEDGYLATA